MKVDNIADLLDAERSRKGFSQEQRAGLWKGIESSVGPIATPPEAPPDAPPEAAPPPGSGGLSSALSTKLGALVAIAAIGGAGLGAAAHARWAEPRIVVVERAAEPAPLLTPSAAIATPPPIATQLPSARPLPSALPAVAPIRASAQAPSPSAAPPARDPALARERNLLDMARTALGRGDSAAALSAVDSHAREFPASQLSEEREVLAIQALASANRLPDARRRAAAFRTSFPKSALLPIVDETTQ